jgi:hypothetical protein
MKLRWWIAGTLAVAVGGLLLMKHTAESKSKFPFCHDKGNENNFSEFPSEMPLSEFEGVDFSN